jgi:hypothetical protein
MTKKRNRLKRAATKLPTYLQDIVFSKNKKPRLSQRRSMGKFGAASPVRLISLDQYEAEKRKDDGLT